MALTNAERQARHRERVKERLALPAATEPFRNGAEASAEAFFELIRDKFEDGMIELLEHGDYASDPLDAIREPRQAATDRFNALGREEQWRLLLDGLRERPGSGVTDRQGVSCRMGAGAPNGTARADRAGAGIEGAAPAGVA